MPKTVFSIHHTATQTTPTTKQNTFWRKVGIALLLLSCMGLGMAVFLLQTHSTSNPKISTSASTSTSALQQLQQAITAGELIAIDVAKTTSTTSTTSTLASSTFTSPTAINKHWLIVNFWASWCPPCVREIPLLINHLPAFEKKHLQLMGVSMEDVAKTQAFVQTLTQQYPAMPAFPYALYQTNSSNLAANFGNAAGYLPFTVLIDPAGNIIERHVGELNSALLASWMAKIPN